MYTFIFSLQSVACARRRRSVRVLEWAGVSAQIAHCGDGEHEAHWGAIYVFCIFTSF
jgi:hypothetical protein